MSRAAKARTRISRTGEHGFTLLELLVVLMLIGTASTLVIISMSKAYKKSVIRYEARKVYSALSYSREISIVRHTELTFETKDENTGYSVRNEKKTFFERTLPKGMTIFSGQIVFFPLGDSTGGLIEIIDDEGRKYEIEVSTISGKARVRRLQPS